MLARAQSVLAHVQAYVLFVMDINICQDIDVDGLRDGQPGSSSTEDPYLAIVEQARYLLRNLEMLAQNLFEDGASFLTHAQTVPFAWGPPSELSRIGLENVLESHVEMIKLEAGLSLDSLIELLSVSREQIASEVRYRESMTLRISRMSILDASGRLSNFFTSLPTDGVDEAEDVVDMEIAFRKGATRPPMATIADAVDPVDVIDPRTSSDTNHARQRSDALATGHKKQMSEAQLSVAADDDDDLGADFLEEEKGKTIHL